MPTEATTKALRALQRPTGTTAAKLQELTGWAARPSGTYLRGLAERHGFKYTQKPNDDGILVHFFTAKAARAAKAAARKAAAKRAPKKDAVAA